MFTGCLIRAGGPELHRASILKTRQAPFRKERGTPCGSASFRGVDRPRPRPVRTFPLSSECLSLPQSGQPLHKRGWPTSGLENGRSQLTLAEQQPGVPHVSRFRDMGSPTAGGEFPIPPTFFITSFITMSRDRRHRHRNRNIRK